MTEVRVPSSIETAVHKLTSVDSLVTAKEWERAAIVAAFVRKGGQGHKARTGFMEVASFASLGIAGLRSPESVRRYRDAWLTTGRASTPGAVVDLDGLGDFPPHAEVAPGDRADALREAAEAEGAGVRSTQQVATHIPALRAAIKADDKVAAAASQALDERWEESRSARRGPTTRETPHDATADALALIVKLRAAHRALADAMTLSQDVRGPGAEKMREAVNVEVDWIRAACEVIASGVNGGSMDDQLRELLDAETGS